MIQVKFDPEENSYRRINDDGEEESVSTRDLKKIFELTGDSGIEALVKIRRIKEAYPKWVPFEIDSIDLRIGKVVSGFKDLYSEQYPPMRRTCKYRTIGIRHHGSLISDEHESVERAIDIAHEFEQKEGVIATLIMIITKSSGYHIEYDRYSMGMKVIR